MRLAHALVLATVLVAVTAAPSDAQRRRNSVDPNRPVPVATNTLHTNPEPYFDKPVLMSAAVEEILSPTTFVVDQRRVVDGAVQPLGQPVLVIAPYLVGAVEAGRYMLMTGDVIVFDPSALAGSLVDYTLDLTPEQAARYEGQVVLVANSVIDPMHEELARIPPTASTAP